VRRQRGSGGRARGGHGLHVRLRAETIEVLVTEGGGAGERDGAGPFAAGCRPGRTVVRRARGRRGVIVPAIAPTPPAARGEAEVTPPSVERALAWQERRLELRAAPLGDVVAEFNRYNRCSSSSPIRVCRETLQRTFRADGYEPFVRLLEENFWRRRRADGKRVCCAARVIFRRAINFFGFV